MTDVCAIVQLVYMFNFASCFCVFCYQWNVEPASRNQRLVGGKGMKRKRSKKEIVKAPRKKRKGIVLGERKVSIETDGRCVFLVLFHLGFVLCLKNQRNVPLHMMRQTTKL